MAPAAGPNPYLKTKIMTASPQELRLMLLDGSLKFCRLARTAIEENNYEASYNHLSRAEKIVLELGTNINPQHQSEMTDKVTALYTYIYRLLVDTNTQRTLEPLDEAITRLEYERETWALLMDKLHEEQHGPVATVNENTAGNQANAYRDSA